MTTAEPLEPAEGPAPAPAASVTGDVVAHPRSVAHVRTEIVGLAERQGASVAMLGKIGLAVWEVATNVVRHACADRRIPGRLRYDADIENGDLEIVIADDGAGFRGDQSGDSFALGLHVSATVSDDFAITTRRDGIEVWMRFVLGD